MAKQASTAKRGARQVVKRDEMDIKYAYALIIEWDGDKPPMSWYNRLHDYGLHVRGSKDSTPIARRFHKSPDGWGVIAQEGIVLAETESLMQQLSMWATKYGAKNVMQGRMLIEGANLSASDDEALTTMVRNWTKTGPKRAAEVGKYVITCMDEVKTFEKDMDALPLGCPDCASHRIQARLGNRAAYLSIKYKPSDVTVYDYWLRTRFVHRMFEIPTQIDTFEKGDVLPPVPSDKVAPVKLPEVVADIKVADETEQLHVYDLSYVVSKMSREQRLNGRLRVLDSYFSAGGMNAYTMASPGTDKLDILDLCILDNAYTRYL